MPVDVTKGKLLSGPPALLIPARLLLELQMGFNRGRRGAAGLLLRDI